MSKQLPSVTGEGRWRLLGLLVANGLAQAAAAMGVALSVERAFGMLGTSPRPSTGQIGSTVAVLVAAAAATAWLRGRERVDAERLGQAYTHRVRTVLFDHLLSMSPRTVQQRSQGSTALRFVGDLSILRRWVSAGLSRLAVAATMTVGSLVLLAFVSPILTGAVAVAVSIGAATILAQGAALRDTTRQARRRRARLAGNVNEKIAAVGVVQVNNACTRERRRVARQSRQLRDAMILRARHLGRMDATTDATVSAATGAVLVTGVIAEIPAPTVAAAMVVVGLLVPQLRGLGRVQEYRQGLHVARDAIDRFLARPGLQRPPANARPLEPGPGRVQLDDVGFGDAITDMTATVEPGQLVVIVGANGAGKSTLLSLVARLVDPDRGRILLDGQDLLATPVEDARRAIGLVAPDLPLLRGSLRRNLSYRQPDADDSDLWALIDRLELRDLLDGLPDGLDTRLLEAGRSLSSGHRQRVLLARALLGDPLLLLLDEADTNLDPATTELVDRTVNRHNGTRLVVTHRRDRLAGADVVWHLAGGRLVEVGTPAELLAGIGPTARLFAAPARRRSARPLLAPGARSPRGATRSG